MANDPVARRVQGDLAKRDLYKDCEINVGLPQLSRIAILLKRLAEGDHGKETSGWISELEDFVLPVPGATVLGVEEKLRAAGRDADIQQAQRYKERVFADLLQNQFSETYQRICLELLGDVLVRFDSYVKPAIDGGADRATIDNDLSPLSHPEMSRVCC